MNLNILVLQLGEIKKIADFTLKITQFGYQFCIKWPTQEPLIQSRYFFKISISYHDIILIIEGFEKIRQIGGAGSLRLNLRCEFFDVVE